MARFVFHVGWIVAVASWAFAAWNWWQASQMNDAGAMGPGILALNLAGLGVVSFIVCGIATLFFDRE